MVINKIVSNFTLAMLVIDLNVFLNKITKSNLTKLFPSLPTFSPNKNKPLRSPMIPSIDSL